MEVAKGRAEMPKGTNTVLDRRTVQNANRNLLELVTPGMKVLDVGCGSGTITKGIADLVGSNGLVTGIDSSQHLIAQAKDSFAGIPNLSFIETDLFAFDGETKYDLISSARVLQWLNNPQEALQKMKSLLAEGGKISILDYNHEKISFVPDIPLSMKKFYSAFLKWRSEAGFDNAVADNLAEMFRNVGLKNIEVKSFNEVSTKGSDEFDDEISIWNKVAESRGKQLVNDGYIKEEERIRAIEDYTIWMRDNAEKMELYLNAVTGEI